MKKSFFDVNTLRMTFPVSALSLAISGVVGAQEQDTPAADPPAVMEEVMIFGRMKAAAFDIVTERMDLEVAADLVDAEQISRVGDSNVAAALRRLPGVTLVNGQYVYVRGLGERYSSTTLNGAVVPSPDLSRNVIPLDIFPTSIVESLSVQKVFSADMPAAFGGGSVDIRTRSIPEGPVLSVELGSKLNTASRADALAYNGANGDDKGKDDGTRAFSSVLDAALDHYLGSFAPTNIATIDGITFEQANTRNRELLSELHRDISIYNDNTPQTDFSGAISAGNMWYVTDDIEVGVMAGFDYERTTRSKETMKRILGIPDEGFTQEFKTTHNVSMTGDLSFGVRFDEDNTIETTSLFIRNTDDDVSIANILNTNKPLSGGLGFREYGIRYEAREMRVNQIHGDHEITLDVLERLNLSSLEMLEGLKVDWYYSDAESTTDIPSELKVTSDTTVDTTTGAVLSDHVGRFSSSADYRFTDLQDYVESYGWNATMPLYLDAFEVNVSGGSEYWEKARIYEQGQMYIDTSETPLDALYGPLGGVFSGERIANPANAMQIRVAADNEDSYMAANKVLAAYGKLDVNWDDTLRVVAGLRWEDYKQVNLPWNPLNYTGSQLVPLPYDDPEAIVNYFDEATYMEDGTFGSLALTYMLPGFWAEDFQLRASYGQTTVRPDLREISPGSFRDPVTDILVFGNPDVVPAIFDNIDIRAEWFFSNGDNFTASLFYKDIENPIELFSTAASDDNIAAEVINAQSGSISGVEVEFMKNLEGLADVLTPFFVQGNFTVLSTEIIAGNNADAPTNPTRPMAGASDNSGNLILGFDSDDELHSATLSLNYFSERLFFAGRNGREDTYEQPFTSLDFTYSFYPTDQFTVKFKAQNLLDEKIEIAQFSDAAQSDVVILEQDIGKTFSLDIKWSY